MVVQLVDMSAVLLADQLASTDGLKAVSSAYYWADYWAVLMVDRWVVEMADQLVVQSGAQ